MTEQLQLPNNPNVLPRCTAELGVMELAGNDNALREIIKQKLSPITRGVIVGCIEHPSAHVLPVHTFVFNRP